ncbi:MAG TPA: hypothetical protein VE972_05145 [Conexibacter sp.]|nr:hypothetical protein [Conexibacter sp.]
MSVSRKLNGRHLSLVLPVTLSHRARRDVLLRTGVQPTAGQIFVVKDLTDLEPALRTRMIDVWEKVNIHVDETEIAVVGGQSLTDITGARNDGYLWLQRDADERWTRYLPDTDGDSIDVDAVFYPTPGRTVNAFEHLRATLDQSQSEALDAMLAGAPLVDDLGEDNDLGVAHVLAAYERALGITQRLIELVDAGIRDKSYFHEGYKITEDAVFLYPDLGQRPPNRPAAILAHANPQAYDQARRLLAQLDSVPQVTVIEKLDRVCCHWWSSPYAEESDARKVDDLLHIAVVNALSDFRGAQAKRQADEDYEQRRAQWIDKHGSQRLKRAAARGYRHDGIYRDERLHVELPDFVGSVGRKPTVRELVNPSEHALELEAQALARAEALDISDDRVRLVYVQTGQDVDWEDGEFVQIDGYLGRHTVWRSVSGERIQPDIPF